MGGERLLHPSIPTLAALPLSSPGAASAGLAVVLMHPEMGWGSVMSTGLGAAQFGGGFCSEGQLVCME